jgi:two-component system response regulator (stage 0 sporulation protein F)
VKKLLLVDDDDSIQLLYQEEFKDEGYQVDSARNGEEALARFAENRPDLVILDVMMPGLNGIEVLRQLKSRDPSVPVLINSAYFEYKQDLGAWAADGYIVKSADLTELKAAAARLLN